MWQKKDFGALSDGRKCVLYTADTGTGVEIRVATQPGKPGKRAFSKKPGRKPRKKAKKAQNQENMKRCRQYQTNFTHDTYM